MNALSARDGYRLWAPHYATETAVSWLENHAVAALGVATVGRRLLDVGCGTARRLRNADAAIAVGVDLTPEMLGQASAAHKLAAADVRSLPFAAASFDVVWSRLMIGHVRELAAAYAELSRVCCIGGVVVVSDLCSEAIAAGHRRTFRDSTGALHEVEHFVHTFERHAGAARNVGLELERRQDGVVGPDIRRFYAEAFRLAAYEEQRGMRLVVALSFRKQAA